jgi:hypothetical protein
MSITNDESDYSSEDEYEGYDEYYVEDDGMFLYCDDHKNSIPGYLIFCEDQKKAGDKTSYELGVAWKQLKQDNHEKYHQYVLQYKKEHPKEYWKYVRKYGCCLENDA